MTSASLRYIPLADAINSFDNGLMGGIINQQPFLTTFGNPGPPSSVIIGLLVSIMEVGAFFGSIVTAIWGEKLGRRRSIAIGTTISLVGTLLQATSYYRSQFIVARIVTGIGLGMNNSTVPVLLAEYAPKASRGLCKLTSFHQATLLTHVSRCLYAAHYPQLWYLLCLLDGLWLLLPH